MELREALQQLVSNGNELYAKIGIVKAVNGKSCNVEPIDSSTDLVDVPLQSDIGGEGLISYPAVGSHVLVVFTSKHNGVIVNCSNLDKLSFKLHDVELDIDKDGFLLRRENETLKQILNDLLTAIGQMVFTTNAGPTIKLVNAPQFTAINKRINKLFK